MDYEGALLGECLGNYRLVRTIGCGSMGEVYEAEHVLIGRRVAIKVLLQTMSRSAEAVGRFFTEARTAATMRHPGIVEVFDFGYLDSGSAFIVMELLEGETVAESVERRGPLPITEAVSIGRKLASAMACAHACGVIHRDLKPENLYLVPDEDVEGGKRLKVLDFGIAKLATASLFGSRSTRTGQIMGTPAFMSPEQCHGASNVDERSDIYSLGCILYFMLTGRPPFDSDGVGETIAAQLYEAPIPPARQVEGIPARVNAIVMHLLEKNPDDRPGSMDDVAQLLAAWMAREADNTVPLRLVKGEAVEVVEAAEAPVPEPLPARDSKPNPVTIMPGPYYSLIDIDKAAEGREGQGGHEGHEATAQVPKLSLRKRARERKARLARRSWMRWWTGSALALTATGVVTWTTIHFGLERYVGQFPWVEAAVAAERPEEPTAQAPAFAGRERSEAPARVRLQVTSRPAGAAVVRVADGAKLGITPLDVEVAMKDGATGLRLSKLGFVSEDVKVPADRDAQASIVLQAKPVVRPAAAAAGRKGRGASLALGANASKGKPAVVPVATKGPIGTN